MAKPGRLLVAALVTLTCALTGTGCSDLAADSPLQGARTSPEALAEAALRAIEAQSEDSLRALLISRDEYQGLLWPTLPDREHVPFAFVWGMSEPRSRKARRNVLHDYRGVPLELVAVSVGDDVERYDEFTIYSNARMRVRRTDTGEEGFLPLMDAIVRMDGGWKFLNYRDDL